MYTLMILEIYIPNCPNEGHNETSHVVDDSGSGEKKKSLKLFLSLGFARREESSKKTHKKIFYRCLNSTHNFVSWVAAHAISETYNYFVSYATDKVLRFFLLK